MKDRNFNTYLVVICFLLLVYITWTVLQPFIIGLLLAYLLLPLQKILNKYTRSQTLSVFIIMTLLGVFVSFMILYVLQFVYNEFIDILSRMPVQTQKLFEFLGFKNSLAVQSAFEDLNKTFSFESILSKLVSYFLLLIYKILRGNFTIFMEMFSFVFITPVSTVFSLLYLSKTNKLIGPYLPPHIYLLIRRFILLMNNTIYKFLYSQFLVMLFQFSFYYIMLSSIHMVRIKFFLCIVCLGSFVPSFGSLAGLFSCVVVSFIENTPFYGGILVFIMGYIYENYGLIPYFIGQNLEISTFFIWCCVIIGGRLFGIIGFIFAIPVASVIYEMYFKSKQSPNLYLESSCAH